MTLELNRIYNMDCLDGMRDAPENCIDAIVTDPPYALTTTKRWKDTDQFAQNQSDVGKRFSKGFMGKEWDGSIPGIEIWQECLRVSKPGAHMLAFGGTRTHHRLMVAIEDAGWEIRDCLGWIYGSGFPKSLDVSKAIDKVAGVERKVTRPGQTKAPELAGKFDQAGSVERERRDAPATDAAKQWNGWGTALKPAWEPIILCRKPLSEKTVAENVQKWGTGAINIDACRIATKEDLTERSKHSDSPNTFNASAERRQPIRQPSGRFPANLIHDGSDEVLELFPHTISKGSNANLEESSTNTYGWASGGIYKSGIHFEDSGSAARFFYTAKADSTERNKYLTEKNRHPTVKPVDLLRYLCRLITPPGGLILDPFCGSGSTGVAAFEEGFNYIIIDKDPESCKTAKVRCAQVRL